MSASSHYTRTAIALHWLIAGFIACAFTLGWVMTEIAFSPTKLRMVNWHKWLGITVLTLAVLRALWRLTHAAPPLLPMPAWQRVAAHALHTGLYLLMFALPLSGWAYSNATGFPIVYLGLLQLPDLVDKDKALAGTLRNLHEVLGWVLFIAVIAHVLAALKHHFLDHDGTLQRMLSARSDS